MRHHVLLIEAPVNLRNHLMQLRPQLVKAAQEVYDEWSQDDDGVDEVHGGGGICDAISRAFSGILVDVPGIDITDGGQDGDDHAYVIVYTSTEAYAIDIPPSVYERGGGYSWTKIPNVTFRPEHIVIEPVSVPDDNYMFESILDQSEVQLLSMSKSKFNR